MGLAKKRLYKPERDHWRTHPDGRRYFDQARPKGVLGHDQAPVACPDATPKEIAMALYAVCAASHVSVGRGGSYDKLKDEYVVVGKSELTGKAQDFKVEGVAVAALISDLRRWNGVEQFDPQKLTKALSGG